MIAGVNSGNQVLDTERRTTRYNNGKLTGRRPVNAIVMRHVEGQSMSKVRVERDSVCMADDIDAPHEIHIESADLLVSTICTAIAQMNYLPCISGGKATWIVRTERGGCPLAVIAQQWNSGRLLSAAPAMLASHSENGEPYAFVEYYCQVDPELVYDALEEGRDLPDQYA